MRRGPAKLFGGIHMDAKAIICCAAALFLCLIYIAVRIIKNGQVPGFAVGFAGVMCGILIKCLYDKLKNPR